MKDSLNTHQQLLADIRILILAGTPPDQLPEALVGLLVGVS